LTTTLILSAFLTVAAIALAIIRPLLPSVLFLSAYSGIVVVLLAVLGAVDVAFTEAVVGAGVSTVVLMALLRRVPAPDAAAPRPWVQAVGVIAAIAVGVALLPGILALPAFGDPTAPAALHVSPEYVQRTIAETHTPNVVTAILADYRGFDTLIETTVIMTAAVACVFVLGRRP
jgi:multicomponent Na+:H+ antiporter subunit B